MIRRKQVIRFKITVKQYPLYQKYKKTKMSNQALKILYIDDTCKITNVCILIKKYYFPLPTSRTIMFDQIQKISLETAIYANQKWGPSRHNLNNWFSLDKNRRNKNCYIAIHMKDKKIIPSFTPLDPSKVYNILKEYFQTNGFNSVIFEQNIIEDNRFQDIWENENLTEEPTIVDKQLKDMKVDSKLFRTKKPLMQSTTDNFLGKQ